MLSTVTLAPAIKYAGGKFKFGNRFKTYFAPYRQTHRWCEPFVGAAGAALGVEPKDALLSDANRYLVSMHWWLRNGGKRVLRTPETEERYLELRKIFNNHHEFYGWTESEAFWLLCRLGYNGLCRFNLKGGFNVPVGKNSKGQIQTISESLDLSLYSDAYSNWAFRPLHYREAFKLYGPDDFVYIDPPYDTEFKSYFGNWSWEDQVAVAKLAAAQPGPVLISNHPSEPILNLYQGLGFDVDIIDGRSDSISCKSSGRGRKQEMLIFRGEL